MKPTIRISSLVVEAANRQIPNVVIEINAEKL
jgi:hypothetical protein